MRKFVAAAAAFTLAMAGSGFASAATYVSWMSWSNFSSSSPTELTNVAGLGDLPTAWGYVTLTESAGSVNVSVTLKDGLSFVNTGNNGNHFPFTFNLTNNSDSEIFVLKPNPNDDVTKTTCKGKKKSCETEVTNAKFTYNAPGGAYNQSAFGNFANSFDCCGKGGSATRPAPFEFAVEMPGIGFLSGDDHFYSNAGGWWFSADVVDGNGKTFLIAARDALCVDSCMNLTAVPEPATWSMMLVGFFGLGSLLRSQRRRTRGATVH